MPAEDWIVRAVAPRDLAGLVELAETLGSGMTTFPPDRAVIADRIEQSCRSFGEAAGTRGAQYFLVLEDTATGALLGTSAIYTDVGRDHGFFSYRLIHQRFSNASMTKPRLVLAVSNDLTGATEVGTLAVHPAARGTGAGRLLARSRYVLMAAAPNWFFDPIFAEMRGWQSEPGVSPFWSAVGERFTGLEFDTADRLSATIGGSFVAGIVPALPLYADLLPPDVRDILGKPHDSSKPAMTMLEAEGFRFDGLIDVFDAGPQISAKLEDIETVKRSSTRRVQPLADGEDMRDALLASLTSGTFLLRPGRVSLAEGSVGLAAHDMNLLKISAGDSLLVVAD